MKKPSPPFKDSYKLRIIGGLCRGKIIKVPIISELRPTPDRVRETLFNWLQKDIVGARCLDVFAGSGMLALEALSRGAKDATLIESNIILFKYLQQLKIKENLNCSCLYGDALKLLLSIDLAYDLFFLDPPFTSDYLGRALKILASRVVTKHLVYYETDQDIAFERLGYEVYKASKAGYKRFGLLRRGEG